MNKKYFWLKDNSSSKPLNYIGYISGFAFIFILALFIRGQFFTSKRVLFSGYAINLDTGWTYTDAKGNTEQITLPQSIDFEGSDSVEIATHLPHNVHNTQYLGILNRWDLMIYIDGKLRYSFKNDPNELPGEYVKSHYTLVPIYPTDSGKEIVLKRSYEGFSTADFNSIYYGNRTGIFYLILNRFGSQMIAAIVLFVISLIVMISSYILLIIYRRRLPIILLAYGMCMTSLWFIFDSFLYQVLFGNYYIDGPMEYLLIMFAPYFFARYLNNEQEKRYEKIYSIVCIFIFINMTIMSYLHFSGIRSFEKNILFTGMNSLICIIVFFTTLFIDAIKGYIKRYGLVAIGFSMIIVFGIIQAIVLNVKVDNHDALYLIAGMYVLLFCAVAHMIKQLRKIEDISRRQKHENELKSNFLANMSHEIRTPLNAILGMNEMINRESDDNDIRQYSENIKNAGATLLDIINDILDFSKIESGKMEIIEANYDLGNMLVNLYNIISVRTLSKDLRFSVELDDTIPATYCGDDNRIQQVLINILNNAVKYTKEGSITFKITADSSLTADNEEGNLTTLCISVTDTGIGIHEEDIGKLFETFERIDIKNNRTIEGTGLGLSITNNLVKLMHGTIQVESTYTVGSTFTVRIPQKIISDTPIGSFEKLINKNKPAISSATYDYVAPKAKILVVDDVKINIQVVKGLLKKHKINVSEALSGKECLEICKNEKFDLILLDHMMPEMDGIETMKILKRDYPDICPIVVLTANAISGMKEMYLNEGFDDYLSKPTKPAELNEIILKYVSV